MLEGKLADYIMPDVIRTGGISELRKIAAMAEAFFVPVSPHDATGLFQQFAELMRGDRVARADLMEA